MPACPSCGQENPEAARFCNACGSPLETAPAAREQRKTVTVLFCDVTGSTALGESTDPEALRAVLARYFGRMKGILEGHGASVEKFIGDAVMAVFGVPQVHEDDALRACRAAVEMRNALPDLGLQARIGVNTGEVVTGTEERLATGDAVNIAARLEQAAPPGEVLLGEATLALVRDAVETEPVGPLELKGKAEAVAAHRLLAARDGADRRHETRFVGRERELDALRQAWERAREDERCELVTIVGEPGVGKSRLIAEFLAQVEERVVRGRCPPYGDGITYWPVVEVLKQLNALPSDPAAASSLRAVLGATDIRTSTEEIAWGFRKLLEEQAPLVCVFDDLQWGDETLLDLIDGVAVLTGGVSMLLLCLARPELAERRPQWPIALRLEPLPDPDIQALVEDLPDGLREKIARAAGGNPLFVTEMAAMTRESTGNVTVPPTLKAVLEARLDRLEGSERSVLERGAVEGEIFHRRSVQALWEDAGVTPHLTALVRKQLIRPDKPLFAADDAFRFEHLLIRDAAYETIPKATRAQLHERLADWLERHARDIIELDELVGFHLEQASKYAAELGQPTFRLADRAAEHLARAGRRALWRTDEPAALALLERALTLTRPLRVDVELELDLSDVFFIADPGKAAELAEGAAERARVAGDESGEAVARVVAATRRLFSDTDTDVDELERLARSALPLLEHAGDHAGLARVWQALGFGVANTRGRYEEMEHAAKESERHRRLAGRPPSVPGALALVAGPRPADEALRAFDEAMPKNPDAAIMLLRAVLLAMLARFDDAWPLAHEANAKLSALRGGAEEGWLAEIALLQGDYEAAELHLRRSYETASARGTAGLVAMDAPRLGRILCIRGRHDEARQLVELGRKNANEADIFAQMDSRRAQALIHACDGNHAEAERLAREAVEIADGTDALNSQGDALRDLAEVLATAGRIGEAAEALEQALDRYERKKNVAMVAQVRPRLEELRARVS